MPNLYSVVITGSSGTAPNDGFVDPTTISEYLAAGSAAPTGVASCLATSRANFRWKLLNQQMSFEQNIYPLDDSIVATGADCNTPPSSLSFVALVEHGTDSLYTYDETNNDALLTGEPALVRMIARALTISETTELMYLDPTQTAAPGNPTLYSRVGYRLDQETVGAVTTSLTTATSMVTVTFIV